MLERLIALHTEMVWPIYFLDCILLVAIYGWLKWALGDLQFVASDTFFKMGWVAALLGLLIVILGLIEGFDIMSEVGDPSQKNTALSKAIDTAMFGFILDVVVFSAVLGSSAVAKYMQSQRAEQ